MGKIVIQDTADVTITDIVTGKVVINAEAQVAGIEGSITEEDLRGGIGNKKLFRIRTDKTIDLNMTSALADIEYWAMTQGVEVEDGQATVTEHTTAKIAGGEIDLTGDSKVPATLTEAILVDKDGSQEKVTVTTGVVTVPIGFEAQDGDEIQVIFQKEVTGKTISIDATKFSNKFKVEYKTIAYDVETATVISDIYFIFHEAIPSGAFSISLENGTVYTPEITFSVTSGLGNDEMGQIIEVPREN